jgi:hypothetical protein
MLQTIFAFEESKVLLQESVTIISYSFFKLYCIRPK